MLDDATLMHLTTTLTRVARSYRAVADEVRVAFRVAQRGVAPGQSVVIYRGDELLGGARILRAVR